MSSQDQLIRKLFEDNKKLRKKLLEEKEKRITQQKNRVDLEREKNEKLQEKVDRLESNISKLVDRVEEQNREISELEEQSEPSESEEEMNISINTVEEVRVRTDEPEERELSQKESEEDTQEEESIEDTEETEEEVRGYDVELGNNQRAVFNNLEVEWQTSEEIAKGSRVTGTQVRNTYADLKEKGLIRTNSNLGAKLSSKGLEIKKKGSDMQDDEELPQTALVILKHVEEGWKSGKKISEETRINYDNVKQHYSHLKDRNLITATRNKGVRLTEKGKEFKLEEFGQGRLDQLSEEREQALVEIMKKLDEVDPRGFQTIGRKQGYSTGVTVEASQVAKDEGLIEVISSKGTVITPKGKKFLEEKGEEVDSPQSFQEGKNRNINSMTPGERQEVQEDYLKNSEEPKTVDETLEDVYDLGKSQRDKSKKGMVRHAYDNSSSVEKKKSNGSRKKLYYFQDDEKDMLWEHEGQEAVEKVENRYDEYIDGDTKYNWIKKAFAEMIPKKGEKNEISFNGGHGREAFIKHFAVDKPNVDQRAWLSLCSQSSLQKALKYELNLKDMDIRAENTSGGNFIDNATLVLDRSN